MRDLPAGKQTEHMRKIYVDVEVRWNKDGSLIPLAVWWLQGIDEWERYEIDQVLSGPILCAALTGGTARRYEVKIGRGRRFLYLDDNRWFLETNR